MRKLKLLLTLCLVAIAANASKTVYLKPSANWLQDNARFALYMFTGTDEGVWTDFAAVTGAEGIYSAEFNETYASMILCRMNPGDTENKWDNKWNQSDDLTAPAASGLLYTLAEGWDNPTVTVSIYGATAASFENGKYLFKNVGSGKYLGPGTNYGTRASLLAQSHFNTLQKVSDGVFKIESQVSNGGNNYFLGLNSASDMYLDNGGKNVTITKLDNGKYVLSFDGESTYIGFDGTNKYTVHNLTDYSANNAQWTIVSYEDALAGATDQNPIDATFMILDQNFDRNHRSSSAWTMEASNKNLCGGKEENKCAESWKASFTLSQTITVPNGYYKIRAQAACWEYDVTGADYPVVYADEVSTPFKKMTDDSGGMDGFSTRFANGEYFTDWSDMLTVTDKKIVVGVKGTRTNTWCIWDNIQLMYYGPIDLSGFAIALADAVAAAQATNGTIPTACYNAIETVVNENNKTYTSEDDYTAAINAINNAVATYASANIVAAYERYNRIKTAVLAINNSIDTSNADAAANAATTNTAIDAAVPTLRNALTTYLAGVDNQEIDVTAALIDNPSPGTSGNLDWWNTNKDTGYGNYLYEFYNKEDASSRQTIPATMPVGYYKMTVVGYTREGQTARMFVDKGSDNVKYQQLVGVAKDDVNNLSQGNSWIADGNGVNEMVFNLDAAAENNLTIGIWGGDTGDKWTAWRSFKLEYLGTDPLVIFQNNLADAAAAANAHATELGITIPAGAMNIYTTAISTAAAKNTTKEECLQSIQDIKDATAAADACVAPYAAYNTLKTAVQALYDVADYDELTTDAHDNLGAALTTAATNVAAATDAAGITAVSTPLKAAGATYAGAANPTGTAQFDLTFMLDNPDVTKYWNGTWWIIPDGWASEQSDGNKQVMQNDQTTNGDHKVYFEYWSSPAKTNGLFNLYTSVTLPKGTYNMSCWAFAKDQGDPATNGAGVYFYANDTQGSQVASDKLTEQHIEFVNESVQEVKIGLKPTSGNTYNWMGIGYVQLFKIPAKTYTIDEGADYDVSQEGAGDVELTRTIKANTWNTIWLPFSMTEAELKATFGDDVAIAKFSETVNENATNQSTINFNKMSAPAISPNDPVLLKTSTAGTAYTIESRTVVAGIPQVAGTNFNFVGTTAASTDVASGDYFISSNKLYTSKGATTLKGTRAYLKTTATGARIVSLVIDGEDTTTAIEDVENGTFTTGKVYNLQGQEVKSAQKGIFIQNGKKVVLK